MHTTLHEAARSQEHLARFLTARGDALDGRDERGATPLHHALHAVLGSVLVPTPAWTLLALGASADLPDLDGTRPLHLACRGARRDVVWLLRCCGAEAARVDGAGRTPEDLVPQAARAVILPLLREPPPVARGDLVTAAARDPALAAALLRAGADPATRDADGRTALHTCTSDAILVALLALGADPCATDARGQTPLHVACRGLGRSITLLLQAGADPARRDADGRLAADFLREQRLEPDFYDGDRLAALRDAHLAALSPLVLPSPRPSPQGERES